MSEASGISGHWNRVDPMNGWVATIGTRGRRWGNRDRYRTRPGRSKLPQQGAADLVGRQRAGRPRPSTPRTRMAGRIVVVIRTGGIDLGHQNPADENEQQHHSLRRQAPQRRNSTTHQCNVITLIAVEVNRPPPGSFMSRCRETTPAPVAAAFGDRANRRRTRPYVEDSRTSQMPRMQRLVASQQSAS